MNLQELANKEGRKVYLYKLKDRTIVHSIDRLKCGDILEGKSIIEILGAFVPKEKEQNETK